MIVAQGHGGFRGSPFFVSADGFRSDWDVSHIAMTYTGLALLAICGDDLSDIDRAPIRSLIRSLQRADGGIKCHVLEDDTDLRFLFRLPHCPRVQHNAPALSLSLSIAAPNHPNPPSYLHTIHALSSTRPSLSGTAVPTSRAAAP